MAETPIAVPNDTTVVSTSSTGASTDRSSTMRMSRMTTSTIGMIRLRSWIEASLVSIAVAVVPPTRAFRPSASIDSRICRTVSVAASESAASESVACSMTLPSTAVGSGAGVPGGPIAPMPSSVTGAVPDGESSATTLRLSTPSMASRASAVSSNWPSSVTTFAGLPEPPGKCSPSSAWPSRASDAPSTSADCATPCAFNCRAPTAPRSSSAVVASQMTRGRRLMIRASQAQTPFDGMPCSASTAAGSNLGRRGQNAARPNA